MKRKSCWVLFGLAIFLLILPLEPLAQDKLAPEPAVLPAPASTPAPAPASPATDSPQTTSPPDATPSPAVAPPPTVTPPVAPPPTEPLITIAAVGDIYLGSWLEGTIRAEGPDYPWKGTEKILKGADIAVCNLESPLSTKSKIFQRKKWTLRAHPSMVKSLAAGGFKVATLANNHMMDFGPEALRETLETLDGEGILHTGAGMNLAAARTPAMAEIKGKKIAFLAYGKIYPLSFYAQPGRAGIAPGTTELVEADIRKAKETAQYVVVAFHWGAELMRTPKDYQRALAHAAIDAGADLVIGHHPHVLQGVELYQGKVIAYSLGNFAFGSMATSSLSGGILTVTFQSGRTIDARLWPANVNNHQVRFQPQLMEASAAQKTLEELRMLSQSLGTNLAVADNAGRIEFGPALAQDNPAAPAK